MAEKENTEKNEQKEVPKEEAKPVLKPTNLTPKAFFEEYSIEGLKKIGVYQAVGLIPFAIEKLKLKPIVPIGFLGLVGLASFGIDIAFYSSYGADGQKLAKDSW